MTQKLALITILWSLVALSGCDLNWHPSSYVHNRVGEYQPGSSVPPLKLPAGVATIPDNSFYRIPDIPNPDAPAVTLLPPGGELMKQAQLKNHKQNGS